MTSPILSVIIPTYNRADYVRDCVLSLNRCGLEEMEIIVADDGSTDNTKAIVQETAPWAKYLWQANTGTPSTARNAGFSISTGKYVGFLDCDDAWQPKAPMKAVDLLERYPQVDVLFADAQMGNPEQGYQSWIEVAGQQQFFELPGQEPEPGFRILDQRSLFRRMAVRNPLFIGACIMRRDAFAVSGGFDKKLRGAADWDLWLRMASKFTFGFMNEPLAYYTRHLDNMSSNEDHMSSEFCQALSNTLSHCELEPEDVKHIRACLHHHMFNYAYLAYDRGDTREARIRFQHAIKAGNRQARTIALNTACLLPGWMLQRLRGAKQPHEPLGGC